MCVFISSPLSMELLDLLWIVNCKTQLPFLESGGLETEGGASDKAVFAFANHNKNAIRSSLINQ